MKFRIQCSDGYGEPWWEEYNEDVDDPQKWAEKTIAQFNATRRGPERERTLLAVEVLDASNAEFHHWVRRTDGMSVMTRYGIADLMYCKECGITGKRYGLSRTVEIDAKFRKKAFQRCDTAQKEMRRKEEL